MGTLFDYLDWRGDLLFSDAPLNEVDNLIFTQSGIAWLRFVIGLSYLLCYNLLNNNLLWGVICKFPPKEFVQTMTILCVDDHPVIVKGLKNSVKRIYPEATILTFTVAKDAAVELVFHHGADVAGMAVKVEHAHPAGEDEEHEEEAGQAVAAVEAAGSPAPKQEGAERR